MLTLDGDQGEGGGQILRTSLALAIITQTPIKIRRIRANRSRPGLQHQHLTAVEAAATICGGRLKGATLNSDKITFHPGPLRSGEFDIDIGTAGSTSLVLQTLLPPLMRADTPSSLTITGGTHNPLAPTWDFLERSYLPLLRQIGFRVEGSLERHGFYPRGNGRLRISIDPPTQLTTLELLERAPITGMRAKVLLSSLPGHIAERELAVLDEALDLTDTSIEHPDAKGPGNAVILDLETGPVHPVFSAIGQKGVQAEHVAGGLVREVQHYIASDAPVDEHLADQLLLPLVMAGGGTYVTSRATPHTLTNIDIIHQFIPGTIVHEHIDDQRDRIQIRGTL